MADVFDENEVAELGWRQGAILDQKLAELAWRQAPKRIEKSDRGWLLVTSHDCDLLNPSLAKEPVVELMHATVVSSHGDSRLMAGRNPRELTISAVEIKGKPVDLSLVVHDRWLVPRELLMEEPPIAFLSPDTCRLVAEWLAKRYIRAAFPTAFDIRWRQKFKAWRKLLKKHSFWLQGVYLDLKPLRELPDDEPYRCKLLLAVPSKQTNHAEWPDAMSRLEREFEDFWSQFSPRIELEDIYVWPTDRITLADIERYQRFDADWISFEDGSARTLVMVDYRS